MDHRGGDRRGDGLGSGYQRRYGARGDWRGREVVRRDDDWNRNNNYHRNDGRMGGGRGYNGGRVDGRGFKRRAKEDEVYWNNEEDLRHKLT